MEFTFKTYCSYVSYLLKAGGGGEKEEETLINMPIQPSKFIFFLSGHLATNYSSLVASENFTHQIKLMLSIFPLNFSRQAGDLGSNLVARWSIPMKIGKYICSTIRQLDNDAASESAKLGILLLRN